MLHQADQLCQNGIVYKASGPDIIGKSHQYIVVRRVEAQVVIYTINEDIILASQSFDALR